MTQSFTREEFYDLVWSKPMTHLAKEFRLSDVALHKICKKHDIPKPPLGWWAKKQAGKPVRQTPLPPAAEDKETRISITAGELRGEPELMAVAREEARIAASSIDSEADVPSHPIIERTTAKLRKAKPAAGSILVSVEGAGVVRALIGPESVDRFEQVLNRIVAAAATLGIKFERCDKGAVFMCDGEAIGFSVSELTRREKHVLTEKEQAEYAAWKSKRDRYWARRSTPRGWDDDDDVDLFPPRFPEWDYHPTGQLSFELDQQHFWNASPRKSFRDAKVQRLELIAGDIAVGIAVYGAAMKADRIRREEDARQCEEERRQREQAERAEHVEKRRYEALDNILDELAALERLRSLVGGLRSELASTAEGRAEAFLAFAEKRLAIREAAFSADGLQRRFEKNRLFGDDDDHDFRPSRYYF
ncbi:hypothetical protein [Sphingopyxis sp.]|uniref:hypothetical protein n=1 Tax=Sphingopyxis sp. TaxID=1908224 RepID=UPI002B46E84E|nr:hypothetical protein [Sphingopyxis sp.]HJS12962.1 hypothetical protein [Sphingopyxis sp.]